jgi:hypothetical protein
VALHLRGDGEKINDGHFPIWYWLWWAFDHLDLSLLDFPWQFDAWPYRVLSAGIALSVGCISRTHVACASATRRWCADGCIVVNGGWLERSEVERHDRPC